MNPHATLNAVRALSEGATLRPAPKRLRLTKPNAEPAGPRRATIAYEDKVILRIGGAPGSAGNNRARKPKETDHCASCGKRPEYCYCGVKPREKNFMQAAAEKAEAALQHRPVIVPRGEMPATW